MFSRLQYWSFVTVFYVLVHMPYLGYAAKNDTQLVVTPHFLIHFPNQLQTTAQQVANTLETIYSPVSKTLRTFPKPIRVLIYNQSSSSNGSFMGMPRHMKLYNFYTPDPYFIGNGDWLTILSLHEFRHAVQYQLQYESTPILLRPFYFLMGVAPFLGTPRFFSEGDAVCIETALSKNGRGRIPAWEMLAKVNLLEHGINSFGQQLFGSLRYPTPDEYHIGYQLTTYIRRQYGVDAIRYIYQKSLRRLPYFGFFCALQEATGRSVHKLYREMKKTLIEQWRKQLAEIQITPAAYITILPKQKKVDCNYVRPFMNARGEIFAWKSGIGLRNQLVQLRLGGIDQHKQLPSLQRPLKEQHITFTLSPLSTLSHFFGFNHAVGEKCAVWLECCLHPWRGQGINHADKNYIIRLQHYSFATGKKRTLMARCYYNAVALSPNSQKLVAVKSDLSSNHCLDVLDVKSGGLVKTLQNLDGVYYLTPTWCSETDILVVQSKHQKNRIVRINTLTEEMNVLADYTYEHRNYPILHQQDYLLYNSSINGIDNIYALHLPTKCCFQVTSRAYGAYLGMVDGKTNQIIFSDYTSQGMKIAYMDFDPTHWLPIEKISDHSLRLYEPLVRQEDNGDILDHIPRHIYPTQHVPLRQKIGFTGFTLTEISYRSKAFKIVPFELLNLNYDFKLSPYFFCCILPQTKPWVRFPKLGIVMDYCTFYPIMKVKLFTEKSGFSTWAPGLEVRVNCPYYFALSSSLGEVNLGVSSSIHSNQSVKMAYTFALKNQSTQSDRDIKSPWRQSLSVEFTDFPFVKKFDGASYNLNSLKLQLGFDLPGCMNHHYISLFPAYNYLISFQGRSRGHQFTINCAYGFPLCYPDLELPFIFFLKRMNLETYYLLTSSLYTTPPNTSALIDQLRPSTNDHQQQFGISLYTESYLFAISPNAHKWKIQLNMYASKDKNNRWNPGYNIGMSLLPDSHP